MKINFLLVKDFFKGGGVETYTRGVGSRLVKRGHEVTVYSTGGTPDSPTVWEGMNIVWLPKIRPFWAEKFGGALMATYKELTNERPDVVHLHSVAAGTMAPLLKHGNTPCVVQMHGVEWMRSRWGAFAQKTLKTMEKCSIAGSDAVTAVSKTQCDYYARQYGAYCEYIPTAVEVKDPVAPKLITDLGLRAQEYLLFAARLVPEKGVHYLIPAFRKLDTDYSLVIAGGAGSDTYYRQLRDLAGDDPRIVFLGDVRGRLLEELLSNARTFVQPSELEGLSIGLLEAMSYGLQCVSSDIPENLEVIADTGVLFRSKDTEDLHRALAFALRDPERATEMGLRARRRVSELFSWELVVDHLEDLYGRVIADRGRSVAAPVTPKPRPFDTAHVATSGELIWVGGKPERVK